MTPQRRLMIGDLRMLVFQTPQGETGLLEGHAPLLGQVDGGVTRAFPRCGELPRQPQLFATGSGFVRAFNDRVTLLLEQMLAADEIDVDAMHSELTRVGFALGTIVAELEPDSAAALRESEAFMQAALAVAEETAKGR